MAIGVIRSPLATLMLAFVTLVLTLLAATPPLFMAGLSPMGFFLGVFVFTLVSAVMPVVVIVLLSLIADTVSGAPLGLHGLVALALVLPLERQARVVMRQPVTFIWLALAALLLLAGLLMCGLLWLLGQEMSLMSAGTSWLVTLPLVLLAGWAAVYLGEDRD